MGDDRSYRQYCAIAFALDRLGDRWTLLILRDLLAGPARFGDFAKSLPGIPSNLLTERLKKLTADGLVEQRETYGVTLYELTPLGESTREIVGALGEWGRELVPVGDLRDAESMRALAVPMQHVFSAGLPAARPLTALLDVDGQPFTIDIGETVQVRYGAPERHNVHAAVSFDGVMSTLMAHPRTDAELDVEVLDGDPEAAAEFGAVLDRALSALLSV